MGCTTSHSEYRKKHHPVLKHVGHFGASKSQRARQGGAADDHGCSPRNHLVDDFL